MSANSDEPVPSADVEEDLRGTLDELGARVAPPLSAREYVGRAAESASRPQKFLVGDSLLLYAIKFSNNRHGDGRALAAEHLVGSLGRAIGAPVATVSLVDVSQELLDAQTEPIRLEDDNPAIAGVHHGSLWRDGYVGPSSADHLDDNRLAFGALDVLYAWLLCSNDQQFLYGDVTNEVLSVDHSPFFPNGPGGWTKELLDGARAQVERDQALSSLALTDEDRLPTLERLRLLTTDDLAAPVARVPAAWGVDDEDRLALLRYVLARRDRVEEALSMGRAT